MCRVVHLGYKSEETLPYPFAHNFYFSVENMQGSCKLHNGAGGNSAGVWGMAMIRGE